MKKGMVRKTNVTIKKMFGTSCPKKVGHQVHGEKYVWSAASRTEGKKKMRCTKKKKQSPIAGKRRAKYQVVMSNQKSKIKCSFQNCIVKIVT